MLKEQLIGIEEGNNPTLSEPHFDEEWTVLAARQVVPIAELEAQEKRRYSLKLVGAFVLASSLGVVVALASIRLRESTERGVEPVKEMEATTQISSDSSLANEVTGQENEETSVPLETEAASESQTVTRSARRSETKRQVNVDFRNDSSDESLEISSESPKPQPRLVEQWQEGRPRRVQPQKSRNDGGAPHPPHPRDLSNLDEIFEGSGKKP